VANVDISNNNLDVGHDDGPTFTPADFSDSFVFCHFFSAQYFILFLSSIDISSD